MAKFKELMESEASLGEPTDFGHWHVKIFDTSTGIRHNVHLKSYPKNYAERDAVSHIAKKFNRNKDDLKVEGVEKSYKYG